MYTGKLAGFFGEVNR